MFANIVNMKSWLSIPALYRLFVRVVGANKCLAIYVPVYIRPQPSDKLLDIGCGPADILNHLPSVDYWGFDPSQKYINSAINRFGQRGKFVCTSVTAEQVSTLTTFDIVLANGVLHHLNDDEALELFELSKTALKQGGRLITLDNCYGEGQSSVARFIISRDRGRFIRTKNEYITLATKVFTNCKISIRHDLLRIPYTHIIMECTK